MAIKNHVYLEKIDKNLLYEFPIKDEYTYLGVEINSMGSISPTFKGII